MKQEKEPEMERILIDDFSFISNNLQERIFEKFQSGEMAKERFYQFQKLQSDFSKLFLILLGAVE